MELDDRATWDFHAPVAEGEGAIMTAHPEVTDPSRERLYAVINLVVSAAALALLGWLLVLRNPEPDNTTLTFLPAVNAAMNTLSATFITLGLVAIRRRNTQLHRKLMLSAFASSAVFLVGYLVYHYVHGETRFPEANPLRGLYLAILASHIILSAFTLPMVFWTFSLALRGQFARHKRFAKWTYPIWLYVSVTGVVVFLMLRSATSN